MLDFRLPVISDNIVTLFFGMLDPENVGISLLSHLYKLSYGGVIFTPLPVIRNGWKNASAYKG